MTNPFENGHIKNYLLAYASVVVIMILFFIASTLFHDIEKIEKKEFETNKTQTIKSTNTPQSNETSPKLNNFGIKLIDKTY